jgi:simple sugar transport system substrate-binding protein
MKLLRSLGLVTVAAVLAVAGCSNEAPQNQGNQSNETSNATNDQKSGSGDLTIAVVTHGQSGDAFWDIVKSGADQAAEDEKVTVTYNGNGDPAQQSQLIDNAVAQNVDGLVVSMANPDGVKSSVEAAVGKGIPVVTINSGLEQSKAFGAITHIGQSEQLAGEAAGEKLAEAGLKNVICVVHEAGNVGLEQRCAGAKSKLAGGQLNNLQVDIANVTDAQNTIKTKLLADKSIDGVLTLNPVVGKAAVQAKQEAGSQTQLATFDVSEEICDFVANGDLLFAVDQQPYLQGYLPVVFLALKARNGNDVGGGLPVYSGPGFVTKENAAQVKKFAAGGTR